MHDKIEKPRETLIREWLQVTAIIVTAIWTFYIFFFKEYVKPAQEPTALELDIKLEPAGSKDDHLLIKATIKAQNPTNKRIHVPALWFTARAYQLSTLNGAIGYGKPGIEELVGDETVRSYAPVYASEVVAQQRIVFDGQSLWDPKDKTHNEIVFAVPDDKFDFIDMKVSYLFSKTNHGFEAPVWSETADGAWLADFKFKKPKNNAELIEWSEENGAGYNWAITSLTLWKKE